MYSVRNSVGFADLRLRESSPFLFVSYELLVFVCPLCSRRRPGPVRSPEIRPNRRPGQHHVIPSMITEDQSRGIVSVNVSYPSSTDPFCSLRAQYTPAKSPSYDFQARTPSPMNTCRSSPAPMGSPQLSERSEIEHQSGLKVQRSTYTCKEARRKKGPCWNHRDQNNIAKQRRHSFVDTRIKIEEVEPSDPTSTTTQSPSTEALPSATAWHRPRNKLDVGQVTLFVYNDQYLRKQTSQLSTYFHAIASKSELKRRTTSLKTRSALSILYLHSAAYYPIQPMKHLHRLFNAIAVRAFNEKKGYLDVGLV